MLSDDEKLETESYINTKLLSNDKIEKSEIWTKNDRTIPKIATWKKKKEVCENKSMLKEEKEDKYCNKMKYKRKKCLVKRIFRKFQDCKEIS